MHNSYYYTGQAYSINGHDYDAGGNHESGCDCGNGGQSEDDDEDSSNEAQTASIPSTEIAQAGLGGVDAAPALVTFTPYVQGEGSSQNPLRAYMQISQADDDAFAKLPRVENGEPIEVFDEVSQQSYFVRPASCGGNCFCAAEIVRKGTRTEKHY